MAIDDATLELLERRMSERVEARVRKRLFTVYGLIGGGIIGALGWFGYDLATDVRDTFLRTAETTASRRAAELVTPAVVAAEEATQVARTAAESAARKAVEAGLRLDTLNDIQTDTRARIGRTLDQVNDLSASIDLTLEQLQSEIDETDRRIERLNEKSQETYLGGEYAELVRKLADEVTRLDAELQRLGAAAGPALAPGLTIEPDPAPGDPTLPQPDPAPDITQAMQIQQTVADLNLRSESPVFIQFAGIVTREEIEAIGGDLAQAGFAVPPEERIGAAAGQSELRYFFESDAAAADGAAAAVNAALARHGWRAGVTPRYVGTTKLKPKPGVLELWIEPVRQ